MSDKGEIRGIAGMKQMKRLVNLLRGRWRLMWNQCPRCNSDAPAVDDCHVCVNVVSPEGGFENNRRQQYPPSKATKRWWLSRWAGDIASTRG